MARIAHPDRAFAGAVGPVHFSNGVAYTDDHTVLSYAALAGWDVERDDPDSAEAPDVLRGKALDDALDAAGLPKSGTADERRARLAAASQEPAPEPEPEQPADEAADDEAPDAPDEAQDN